MSIILKSRDEIDIMREANRIVAEVLSFLKTFIKPGVTTEDLNNEAERITKERGAIPGFKGYGGYPKSLCVSINEEVVHGIPDKKRYIKDGDIVSLDYGVIYKGYYGDSAITVIVGKAKENIKRLVDVTEKSLYLGIKQAVPGNKLGDIGYTIQQYVESNKFGVVRDFGGHGIGKELHEEPFIPNFGDKNSGVELKEGMTIAIEPMVTEGGYSVNVLNDGWTVVTADKKIAAHFEHTIAITNNGPEILSLL